MRGSGGEDITTLCVLVTGSRGWSDAWTVKDKLECAAAAAAEMGARDGTAVRLIVRHGACYPRPDRRTGRIPATSADWLAHLWCERFGQQQPVPVVEHPMPADWTGPCRPTCGRPRRDRQGFRPENHRVVRGGRSICPAAGMYRNTDMILADPCPDLALAFVLDQSPGTTGCVRRLREHSVPVDVEAAWTPGRKPPQPVGYKFST